MLNQTQSGNIFFYGADSGPLIPEGLSSSFEAHADRAWANHSSKLIFQIEQIKSLRDNWDGEGAMAPDSKLVDSAIELLGTIQSKHKLPPPSRILASQGASIILEWQLPHGEHLEAEILEPYRSEWMLVQPNLQPLHWEESWENTTKKKRAKTEYFSELAAA